MRMWEFSIFDVGREEHPVLYCHLFLFYDNFIGFPLFCHHQHITIFIIHQQKSNSNFPTWFSQNQNIRLPRWVLQILQKPKWFLQFLHPPQHLLTFRLPILQINMAWSLLQQPRIHIMQLTHLIHMYMLRIHMFHIQQLLLIIQQRHQIPRRVNGRLFSVLRKRSYLRQLKPDVLDVRPSLKL